MIEVPLNIVLHANQKVIHSHPAKNKVVKAGKRFGKTKWLLYELVKSCGKPNQIIWYMAPTYKQAKSIAWQELNWMLPPAIVKRSVENELLKEFVNGTQLRLIGCDNEESLRGPKIHKAGFDEYAYIDPYIYPGIIKGQLLGALGEESGGAIFISSPNKKGRNHFTDFHAEAKRKELAGDKDWASFYYTIYDNPTLNREDIQKLKDNTPDDVWQVEYMAIESEFAGQIYCEFHPTESIAEMDWNAQLLLVRAIDWGINHPTVCLWLGVDVANKQVYVLDEYVKSGLVIEESCTWIKRMSGERPVEWTVIDPSTSKRNSQTLRTDKDEFARHGIYCVPGDNRDRGYDITKMFLKKRMLKVHPKCKNLIYQLKNVQWGDDEGEDCTDALRYAMVRIHDLMFGGNLFNVEKPAFDYKKYEHSREVSLFDPLMFPKSQTVNEMNWAEMEVS